MTDYSLRKIMVLEYPLEVIPEVYKPENIAIRCNRNGVQDIGSFCYRKRKLSRKPGAGTLVVLDSFVADRVNVVKLILAYLHHKSLEGTGGSNASNTITSLKLFFDYLDSQDKVVNNLFENYNTTLDCILAYNGQLKHLVLSSSIKKSTASCRMWPFAGFVCFVFPDEPFNLQDMGLTFNASHDRSVTVPALEEEYSNFLALLQSVFDVAYDLTLGNEPVPYKMKVPVALNEPDNTIIISYHSRPIRSREQNSVIARCWDTSEEAKLMSEEEMLQTFIKIYKENGRFISGADDPKVCGRRIKSVYRNANGVVLRTEGDARSIVRNMRKAVVERLETINSDPRDPERVRWAKKGALAFAHLFYAVTSVNLGVALNLKWFENYYRVKSSQDRFKVTSEITDKLAKESKYFQGIKGRRNYSPVEFEITSTFLNFFKKYLKLRQYILNGRESSQLFIYQKKKGSLGQLDSKELSGFRLEMKATYPEIKMLSPRELRATKSDYLISNYDLETTSILLQNSPDTLKKHYAMGTQSTHFKEMGDFLSRLSSPIRNTRDKNEVESAVGSCVDFNHPSTITDNLKVPVDCHQQEGCLFCDKFRLHADEIDVRKLFSLKYVINQTQYLSASPVHFDAIFIPVISRVDHLLGEMKQVSAAISQMIDDALAKSLNVIF